jgi:aspartate aminotransferase
MHKRLIELPKVTCVRPRGAFYCFPNIGAYLSKSTPDAVAFAKALLEKNHVAVVPGNDSGFPTHVRLSFATSLEQIDKGIDRIAKFLQSI